MQFKLIYHSLSQEYNSTLKLTNYYENIFRIGYGHELNTCEGAGSRYPSMWIIYKNNDIPHAEYLISDNKALGDNTQIAALISINLTSQTNKYTNAISN